MTEINVINPAQNLHHNYKKAMRHNSKQKSQSWKLKMNITSVSRAAV